jgi:hypothetical protein
MLELRPTCEHCDKLLPPASAEAMICSYECTFCRLCVETVLENVCPNCGGGFCSRPVRPKGEYRKGATLANCPASTKKRHKPVDAAAHSAFAAPIKAIPPEDR